MWNRDRKIAQRTIINGGATYDNVDGGIQNLWVYFSGRDYSPRALRYHQQRHKYSLVTYSATHWVLMVARWSTAPTKREMRDEFRLKGYGYRRYRREFDALPFFFTPLLHIPHHFETFQNIVTFRYLHANGRPSPSNTPALADSRSQFAYGPLQSAETPGKTTHIARIRRSHIIFTAISTHSASF